MWTYTMSCKNRPVFSAFWIWVKVWDDAQAELFECKFWVMLKNPADSWYPQTLCSSLIFPVGYVRVWAQDNAHGPSLSYVCQAHNGRLPLFKKNEPINYTISLNYLLY